MFEWIKHSEESRLYTLAAAAIKVKVYHTAQIGTCSAVTARLGASMMGVRVGWDAEGGGLPQEGSPSLDLGRHHVMSGDLCYPGTDVSFRSGRYFFPSYP
ncbi:hypothetical protein ElyMa_006895400 [Elysia marginata]|uniref:Uncharacterized protein n=1 Tax=Elysia marginata TaxID=1093978 RepID=A0AAV4JDZ1_9GAST|nr:hypothetical protein ElyMa_006895400 [Elysia marginata]